LIIDPTYPNHIHIRAGGVQDNSSASLYLGGENSNVSIPSGENPQINIVSNNYLWSFNPEGTISFPDSTIQTTAFTGIPTNLVTTGSNQFNGNQIVTGSVVANSFTGSLQGTSSWANNAVSSSYPFAVTGSAIYSLNSWIPKTPSDTSVTTNNIVVGVDAGRANQFFTVQNSNIFGYQAGYQTRALSNSNIIGYQAGSNLGSTTNDAILIGTSAGQNSSPSTNIIAIGTNAGIYSQGLQNTILIGTNAGSGSVMDDKGPNTMIGLSAGAKTTNVIHSNIIGNGAGVGINGVSVTLKRDLILIGYNVGARVSSNGIGSNNTIIGTNITLENDRKDSINLGGLIFGTGSYATTTGNPFSGSANGRIGINQPLPIYSLDVSGSGNYTNGLTVTGSIEATNFTGSLQGTSSWANNAVSSSYPFAVTGSSLYTYNTSLVNNNSSIFIGQNAGYSSSNSYLSQYIGREAGMEIQGVSDINTFIGYQSGWRTRNSRVSVFVGYASGRESLSSSFSTFIGNNAGEYASAFESVFIGTYAGYSVRSVTGSIFIGSRAGLDSEHGKYSVLIGEYAGESAYSASYSNFIGYHTGQYARSASFSTFIGYQVGKSPDNTGVNSNNIIIGTNISLENGRKDSINLGGLIFGTGSYFETSSLSPFLGSANGRIGINQPLPIYSLDVSGSGNYTNGLTITGSLDIRGS
jgi:hypothetical protein